MLFLKRVCSLCTLFLLLFLLKGCGEFLASKRYNPSFTFNETIALAVECSESENIQGLFKAHGFIVNQNSQTLVKLTSNPPESTCSIHASHIAKEHFVRISVYVGDEEQYRIQLNQKEPIGLRDVEKVLVKMKKELIQ